MLKKTYMLTFGRLIALRLVRWTRATRPQDYSADPLAHPALSGMSLVELADLPFEPSSFAAPAAERAASAARRARRPANRASACIPAPSPL
jgi:hypothetical protein